MFYFILLIAAGLIAARYHHSPARKQARRLTHIEEKYAACLEAGYTTEQVINAVGAMWLRGDRLELSDDGKAWIHTVLTGTMPHSKGGNSSGLVAFLYRLDFQDHLERQRITPAFPDAATRFLLEGPAE